MLPHSADRLRLCCHDGSWEALLQFLRNAGILLPGGASGQPVSAAFPRLKSFIILCDFWKTTLTLNLLVFSVVTRDHSWRCGLWAFCSTLCFSVRIPSVMSARSWMPNSRPHSPFHQVHCSSFINGCCRKWVFVSKQTLCFLSNFLFVLFQSWTEFCVGCCTLMLLRGWLWTSCCCSHGSASLFPWQNTAGQRWFLQLRVIVSTTGLTFHLWFLQ